MQGPTTVDQVRPARNRDAGYWTDIVFGRALPATFFSVIIAYKLMLVGAMAGPVLAPAAERPADYLGLTGQLLSLIYFCVLATIYVVRLPKRAGDARPLVVLVSFFGSFAILGLGALPGRPPEPWLYLPAQCLIMAGLAYSLWSLGHLRRSFSILPEARKLVSGGPYGLSRHPLYLGEALAGLGVALPGASWLGAALIVAFLGAQVIRIHIEERVLSRQFPVEYADYRRRVPRYFPVPRPRR